MQTYTVTAQIKVSVMSGTSRARVLTELQEEIGRLQQRPYAPGWSISDASDVKVCYENAGDMPAAEASARAETTSPESEER
jgi:hypothetical protein